MLNAIHFYNIARWLYMHHIPVLPKIIALLIFLMYNSKIPYQAKIGKGTKFGYGAIGVVMHSRSVVGNNCMIGPNTTIGGRSGHYEVPVIGDNVEICTGAKVLGPIKIGNNAIIGANAVVITDIPDNGVAAGVPAKVIKVLDKKN